MGNDDIFNDDDAIIGEIDAIINKTKPLSKPVRGSKAKPKPPEKKQSSKQEDPVVTFALEKGNEELALIFRRWKALVSALEDSAIGKFIMPATIGYAKHLQGFQNLMNYEEDINALSPEGLMNYRYVMKKRSEILAEIFNKYADEYNLREGE